MADSAGPPAAIEGLVLNERATSVLRAPDHHLLAQVLADLRTDHADEVGAVAIYRGLLGFALDPALIAFTQHHLATAQKRLRQIETWLSPAHHSRLLPLWCLAGFLTGALPALLGLRERLTRSLTATQGPPRALQWQFAQHLG